MAASEASRQEVVDDVQSTGEEATGAAGDGFPVVGIGASANLRLDSLMSRRS